MKLLCAFLTFFSLSLAIHAQAQDRGILGQPAPEWKTSKWIQSNPPSPKPQPDDYKGKVLYLYFFQSWCPGCHRSGFPTLKKMTETFARDSEVDFAVIQTVFEGHSINHAGRLQEPADKYDLRIPFGQSEGNSGTPDIMKRYRSGGTPWTVIIDKKGIVRFNDFHLHPDKAKELIEKLKKES